MPEDWLNRLVPISLGIAVLGLWEALVAHFEVKAFLLPAPSAIATAFIADAPSLARSAWTTFALTAQAFTIATALGVGLGVLFVQSRTLERALYPYFVVLQVTPIVSIAPLIVIWTGTDYPDRAVVILAIIAAFFPILANTVFGLRSADRNLLALFQLYGASRWQVLTRLLLPSALPSILAGMKIAAGLALVGGVVAEFVAGSGAATGLAWRIAEAGNRLEGARMFAALTLLSLMGVAIFFSLSWVEWRLLRRWHDSARPDRID